MARILQWVFIYGGEVSHKGVLSPVFFLVLTIQLDSGHIDLRLINEFDSVS